MFTRLRYLDVDLEWSDIILLIASVDWVTAAVIAHRMDIEVPNLPAVDVLLTQRSLRSLGKVTIGAEWGYDMHELSIPFERWLSILSGESWTVDEPYCYEGKQFTGTWVFGSDRHLEVGIGDGGVGWSGDLASLDLITGTMLDEVDLARLALAAAKQTNCSSKTGTRQKST